MSEAELPPWVVCGLLALSVVGLLFVLFRLRREVCSERCERSEYQDRANVAEGIISGMEKQRQIYGDDESGWQYEAEQWREIAKQIVRKVGGVGGDDDE